MTVAIKEPEHSELTSLARVHHEAWSQTYQDVFPASFIATRSPDYFRGRWHSFLDDDVRPVLVAKDDGQLCGFIRYGRPGASSKPQSPATGEILNMYLLPHFRGQGIGTLLLNSAENRLRELEYEDGVLFAVEDMPSSVRFYEKNGWRKTGAERTDLGGLDPFLVRMEKTLG